jgi:hypothetical protein
VCNPAYRAERERVAEFHAVAKLVIHRRTLLGITQRELARFTSRDVVYERAELSSAA